MKKLACNDLGAMECDFVAQGETADEVKKQMFAHAEAEHPDVLKEMSPEELTAINQKMDALLAG
jgi:predicted small metal-binding protein